MIAQVDQRNTAESIKDWRSSRCPATDNAQVTMTERGWLELCRATQKEEKKGVREGHRNNSRCITCNGEHRPNNLKIIDIKEFEQMSKNPTQECESCKETARVRQNHGMAMCPTCAAIFANVNNRLPVVARAIIDLGKTDEAIQLLAPAMSASPTVQAAVDQKTEAVMKRIAVAVRYNGENPEELAAIIEALGPEYDHAQKTLAEASVQLLEAAKNLESMAAERDALASRVSELEKSIEEDKDINLSIMASAESLKQPGPVIAVSGMVQSSPSVSAEVFNLALAQIEGKVSGLSANRLRALARVQ